MKLLRDAFRSWPHTFALEQFLHGLERMPIPIDDEALVISDAADIYGTVADLWRRW